MKVIFFSPHAFIWPHALPEALVAEALQNHGAEIHYIGCERELNSWCIPMDSHHLNEKSSLEDKNNVCQRCVKNKKLIENHFDFKFYKISDFLNQSDYSQIDSILDKTNKDNVLQLNVDGFNIGKIATYDFSLVHKKLSLDNLTDHDWIILKPRLRSTLVTFFAGKNLIQKLSPDKAVFYSSSYSNLLSVREQFDQLKIPTFSIYAGNNWYNRFQRLHISNKDSFSAMINRNELWYTKYHSLPATNLALASSQKYLNTLFLGKSTMVYGEGQRFTNYSELKNKVGIKDHQKVLFMALSSYDELVSAQAIDAYPTDFRMTFSTQVEWIKKTIEFVSKRDDLFLVIRVHPRELPNKRDFKSSEHILELKKVLTAALPANVYVNWPEDHLSVYSWLEIIDLGLTFWSSVGRELALWGLPSLTYAPDYCTYPAKDIGWICNSEDEYYKNIELALKQGWQQDRLLKTYRWLAFELEGAVIDISDKVPSFLKDHLPFWVRGIRKYIYTQFGEKVWFLFHWSPLKNSQLIYNKIKTGQPTEDILEPTLNRLNTVNEEKLIKNITHQCAKLLWGQNWDTATAPSPLRKKLISFLSENTKA